MLSNINEIKDSRNNSVSEYDIHHYKKIKFSDKELQIILYMCEEFNSSEIAKKMYLSKKTIDGIRLKIKNDLKAKNSIGIAKYAIWTGLYKI